MNLARRLLLALPCALLACADDAAVAPPADAAADTSTFDGSSPDASPVDAAAMDGAASDVASDTPTDAHSVDASAVDMPNADAPAVDASSPDGTSDGGSLTICGQTVPRAGAWRAENSRIYFGDTEVRISGLNWFGLETPDRAPHGLWARPLEELVAQAADLGFTALRVPVSPQSIRAGMASASWANRGAIDTGREQLEALLTACAARNLRVLLDFHTCDPGRIGGSLPGSPVACAGYGESQWLDDLRELAALGERFPATVMGIDLCNEPHALTWSAWRDLATRGGEAVLCRNPRMLVFVEGVGNASNNGGSSVFWGENLTDAAREPVGLPRERLVYSPHVYGPSVSLMPYFADASFPRNMPAIWDTHFGHLVRANANVLVGEFCGWYDDARARGDVAWQDAMVAWLDAQRLRGFFYWALNPNSSDTGGVLNDDWRTPNMAKLRLLAPLMR